jgi:hypothetical protein
MTSMLSLMKNGANMLEAGGQNAHAHTLWDSHGGADVCVGILQL